MRSCSCTCARSIRSGRTHVMDLRGIERVSLAAGESRRIEFAIRPATDLLRYDTAAAKYVVDPGGYEVQVGASSADIRQRARFAVSTKSDPREHISLRVGLQPDWSSQAARGRAWSSTSCTACDRYRRSRSWRRPRRCGCRPRRRPSLGRRPARRPAQLRTGAHSGSIAMPSGKPGAVVLRCRSDASAKHSPARLRFAGSVEARTQSTLDRCGSEFATNSIALVRRQHDAVRIAELSRSMTADLDRPATGG